MNAWRCTKPTCHRLSTDSQTKQDGKLRTCPHCGSMVCDVTNTRIGEEFLARQNHVPSSVRLQHMDKKLSLMDDTGSEKS